MSFYDFDQILGYQDINDVLKLNPATSRPSGLGIGEIWLDISGAPYQIKRFNGTGDDVIASYPGYIQSGRISNASAGTITFPDAFSSTPVVVISCEGNATNGISWPYNITTTGFQTSNLKDAGTGSAFVANINWVAIGER